MKALRASEGAEGGTTGRIVREPSETDKKQESKQLLKRRGGSTVEVRPTSPKATKITVGELLDDLVTECEANGRDDDRLAYGL